MSTKMSSDRSFGIVFSVVFIIIGLLPLVSDGAARLWSLVAACIFLVLAFFASRTLAPLNRVWAKFGLLLHHIISPVVMGFLFFVTVTPIGLVMRLFGKRPLQLSFDRDIESYWIIRESPGPHPDSMKHQF